MMLKILKGTILFAGILCGLNIPAAAWDDTGHKISSYIAWERMTPGVRERVIKILSEAPEDSHLSAYFLNYGSRDLETRRRDYFMLTSTWADIIRDRNFDTRYKKYHKTNWHYSDKFWTRRNGQIEYLPAPEDGGLGLEKLVEFDKVIRSNAPDAQKAIAIAWLQHLIGDLHQPLHTSAHVTEIEPKGDQGGNLFSLSPRGTLRAQAENLHWFWDSIVVRNVPNGKNKCDADYLEPLARRMMNEFPYNKVQTRLKAGQFETWLAESLTDAQTHVFSPDLKRFEKPSEKYKRQAYRVARERLALAGYRMGDMFNSAFSVAPVAGAPAF